MSASISCKRIIFAVVMASGCSAQDRPPAPSSGITDIRPNAKTSSELRRERPAAAPSADWQALPLDESGAELGRARLAFTQSMRDPKRIENLDRCMIVSVLSEADPENPPALTFHGKLELRLEATETTAVVSGARLLESDITDARLNACIAQAYVGDTNISLEAGRHHRLSFPVTLHRQPISVYRARYPHRPN